MTFTLRNDLLAYDGKVATWGIAWGDADGDGDMDLWLGHHGPDSSLLVNRLDESLGAFEVRRTPGFGDKHGAVWADLDADGDLDLLQLRGGGKGGQVEKDMADLGNLLLVNEGVRDGVPVLVWPDDGLDESDSRGLYYSAGRGRTPTVLDVDRDGRLDVLIGNDARDDGAFPSAIFVQQPDGTFLIAPGALGAPGNGVSLAMPADFDGDGITDLYLLDEETPDSTIVYGDGRGGFAPGSATLPLALRDPANQASDVAVGDFDNDGTSDLWIATHLGAAYDSLVLNLDGRFVDVSAEAGLRAAGFLTRNVAAGDFDNDGDLDLYAVNGDYGGGYVGAPVPNVLWENTGSATFVIDGEAVAVPQFVPRIGPGYAPGGDNGRGNTVSVGDLNGDGALDLVVGNGARVSIGGTETMTRGTYDLYLGEAPAENDWLVVSLLGTESNVHGIGSTVRATAEGVTRMRFADNGVHEGTQDDPRLHFGFGDLADGARLVLDIAWTSGAVQRLGGVAPGQVLTVVEGQGQAGDDGLVGTAAAEAMGGGDGVDTLSGMAGADTLLGGLGRDWLLGGEGGDSLAGDTHGDRLRGQAGHDTLDGGRGSDSLWGGVDNDVLLGGAGEDLLSGDNGDDTLTGGAEADRFEFLSSPHFGADTITDFEVGLDRILLPAGVTATLQAVAGGTLVVVEGPATGTILLLGLPPVGGSAGDALLA